MNEKCAACNKVVYWNERTRAVNKTWHKTCFRCAGCNKALALGSQLDHGGDPFCHRCYQRNYGARGFRGGSSGAMVYGCYDEDEPTPVIFPSEQWKSSKSLKVTDFKKQRSLTSKDSFMVELAPPAEAELQEAEEKKRAKEHIMKALGDDADEADDNILALENKRGIDEVARHEIADDENRESEPGDENHGTSEDSTESLVRVPFNDDTVSEDEVRELPHHKSLDETDVRQRLASVHGSIHNKAIEVVLAAAEEAPNEKEDGEVADAEEEADEDKDDKESQPKQEGYWDMLEQNQSYRYLRDTVTSWFGGNK